MSDIGRVRIKVCCIATPEEATLAIGAGADALGLVSAMPSGPGAIEEHQIADIAAAVPPPIATFLLTCQTSAQAIVAQARRCGCTTLQLCDRVEPQVRAALREQLPTVRLIQVVHVRDETAIDEAFTAAGTASAILLDSGNQALAVKELGGTGRVHDWTISREIVRRCPAPVFLAGGLRAENVREAVATVRPFGIDVCSGVRSDGRLDEAKLRALISAVSS